MSIMSTKDVNDAHPWIGVPLECGEGWNKLLHKMFLAIEKRIAEQGMTVAESGLKMAQIKEKFGTLRVYYHGGPDISDLVEAAVEKSGKTCDECGRVGELHSAGYWVMTRCKKHLPANAKKLTS